MSRAIEEFRADFQRGVASRRYAPIDTVQAVHRVKSKSDLIGCLDVYCRLFDPDAPPKTREGYEFARAIGEVLFQRALDLSDSKNGLLELVLTMPALALSSRGPDAKLKFKEAIYARRYAILDARVRSELDAKAKKLAGDRKAKEAKAKMLLDHLEEAYQRKNGRAHDSVRDLLEFNSGTPEQRKAFESVATACQSAWTRTTGTFADAVKALEAAFKAYAAYLDREISEPIDLFRVLAWAREPSTLMQVVTVKEGQVIKRQRENRWNSVWVELYTEAAWRGLKLAATKWHIERMYSPPGYVGKDAHFTELPFDAYGARLLRLRLSLAFARGFTDFNQARRKAALGARRKGIELFDELMAIDASAMIRRGWRDEPLTVMLQRIRYENPRGPAVHNQTYWINFRTPGAFTVVWVYDWKGPKPLALLELDSLPGFYFRADAAALSNLNKDAFFRVLGENATALGLFLIAYLQVLGFALNIISAGSSGSLMQVFVNYASSYLVDAATEAAMDIAGIENPWARMAIGTVVGFANLTPNIDAPKVNIPIEAPHIATGHPGAAERSVPDMAMLPRDAAVNPGARVDPASSSPAPSAIARGQEAMAAPVPQRRLEDQGADQARRASQGLEPRLSASRPTGPMMPPTRPDVPRRLANRPPSQEELAFAKPAMQRRIDAQAADQARRAERLAGQAARKEAAANAASVRKTAMQAQGIKRQKSAGEVTSSPPVERTKAASAPSASRYKPNRPKAAQTGPNSARYKPETAKPKASAAASNPNMSARRDAGRPVSDRPHPSSRKTNRVSPYERGVPPPPQRLSQDQIDEAEDLVDQAEHFESHLGRSKGENPQYLNPEADKTAAFSEETGFPVFSGPGNRGTEGAGFMQVQSHGVDLSSKGHAAQGVARYEQLSGHPAPRNGQDSFGVSGSYYAHHAEVKERVIQFKERTNGPTAVSKPMCPHCRLWHQRVAQAQQQALNQQPMTVIDPIYVRRFNSDGSVDVFYGKYGGWPESQIGAHAAHIEPGTPPSTGPYADGSAW